MHYLINFIFWVLFNPFSRGGRRLLHAHCQVQGQLSHELLKELIRWLQIMKQTTLCQINYHLDI